jgi:hypothetical protein
MFNVKAKQRCSIFLMVLGTLLIALLAVDINSPLKVNTNKCVVVSGTLNGQVTRVFRKTGRHTTELVEVYFTLNEHPNVLFKNNYGWLRATLAADLEIALRPNDSITLLVNKKNFLQNCKSENESTFIKRLFAIDNSYCNFYSLVSGNRQYVGNPTEFTAYDRVDRYGSLYAIGVLFLLVGLYVRWNSKGHT